MTSRIIGRSAPRDSLWSMGMNGFAPRRVEASADRWVYRTLVMVWMLRVVGSMGAVLSIWSAVALQRGSSILGIAAGLAVLVAVFFAEFADLTLDFEEKKYRLHQKRLTGDRHSENSFHRFECLSIERVLVLGIPHYRLVLVWQNPRHRIVRATVILPRSGRYRLGQWRDRASALQQADLLSKLLDIPQVNATRQYPNRR